MPRIAPKKAFRLERSAKIRIDQQQGSRNCEPRRAGLAGGAAAGRVDGKIVGVRQLHDLQRLKHRVLERNRGEIIFEAFAVDVDLAAARRHPDTRDGSFTATGGDEFLSLGHGKILE